MLYARKYDILESDDLQRMNLVITSLVMFCNDHYVNKKHGG